MSTSIMSTSGEVTSDALGVTLFHEHLVVGRLKMPKEWFLSDRTRALHRATRQLQQLHSVGVETLVDPSPVGLGRDVRLIAEAATNSGVRVVCATGLYTENSIPQVMRDMSIDDLTAHFLGELTRGIDGTYVRPGVIKCATSDGRISNVEERALRAAARASRISGRPIITHTSGGTMGPEQGDLFREEGLNPEAVVIGHCDDSVDLDYHRRILGRGYFLGLDRVGNESSVTDLQRLEILDTLVSEGFTRQIMLSQDRAAWVVPSDQEDPVHLSPNQRQKFRSGFTHLHRFFLPEVDKRGIPSSEIDLMLRQNPRRLFEAAAAHLNTKTGNGNERANR